MQTHLTCKILLSNSYTCNAFTILAGIGPQTPHPSLHVPPNSFSHAKGPLHNSSHHLRSRIHPFYLPPTKNPKIHSKFQASLSLIFQPCGQAILGGSLRSHPPYFKCLEIQVGLIKFPFHLPSILHGFQHVFPWCYAAKFLFKHLV